MQRIGFDALIRRILVTIQAEAAMGKGTKG